MKKLPVHDLRRILLPAIVLLTAAAWQANYAMIYPLKATLAGLAGISLAFSGFYMRYGVLAGYWKKEGAEQWKTGSRLLLTGLAFYSLHPVAIALTILGGFLYPFKTPLEIPVNLIRKYEAPAWLTAATLFLVLDFIREYTVWKKVIFSPVPLLLYGLAVVVFLYSWFNVRSSAVANENNHLRK